MLLASGSRSPMDKISLKLPAHSNLLLSSQKEFEDYFRTKPKFLYFREQRSYQSEV